MIKKTYFIDEDNGYKRFNYFEISNEIESILFDDYYLYNTNEFTRNQLTNSLYNKNFVNKYDKQSQKEVFELYIDNPEFKKKAQFIYSIVDEKKLINFVESNCEITDPNKYSVKYYILDSAGVKVQIYSLNIVDISFVF